MIKGEGVEGGRRVGSGRKQMVRGRMSCGGYFVGHAWLLWTVQPFKTSLDFDTHSSTNINISLIVHETHKVTAVCTKLNIHNHCISPVPLKNNANTC